MIGENQKKPVATIDSKTFEFEIFNSLSECSKKLNTSAKTISAMTNTKNLNCYKGKTAVFYRDDDQLKCDIVKFKEKRNMLDNRKNEMPEIRICYSCKKELPLTNEFFHQGRHSIYKKESLKRQCKECVSKRSKKNYIKNKEERSKNFEKQSEHVFRRYKKLDRYKTDFNLTLDWVKENLPKPCIYCGFESNGFDRKDNSIGHTINNCVPCCTECNNGRMDNFSHEEFFIIGDAIRQIKINRIENE